MSHLTCVFCGRPCGGDEPFSRDCTECGTYVTQVGAGLKERLNDSDWFLRLRGWVHAQNRRGIIPSVNADSINAGRTNPIPGVPQRTRIVLHEASRYEETLGDSFNLNTRRVLAATYSRDQREVETLIRLCKARGWIAYDSFTTGGGPRVYKAHFELAGYQAIEDGRRQQTLSEQAFIAMWFDDSMSDARRKGIIPAIEEAGYKPMVIDEKEHNRKICDEIIAEIRRSRFMVADFTHGDSGARGSVYYEAGFAEGHGLEVIGTCREDQIEQIHFDRRQYSHVIWKEPEELRERLTARICAVVGDGPLRNT